MSKFRKKPVVIDPAVIDAVQYVYDNFGEVKAFINEGTHKMKMTELGSPIIETLKGDMVVNINDWVIRGVQGEYYPCKPDIFESTYEPA